MIKKLLIIFLFISMTCVAFASENIKEFFPSKKHESIMPSDNQIGVVCDITFSEHHLDLFNILTEDFSFDWCEEHFSELNKVSMASLYSPLLSKLLPAEGFLFSRYFSNGDGSFSISVKFKNGDIVVFTLQDKRIIAITY